MNLVFSFFYPRPRTHLLVSGKGERRERNIDVRGIDRLPHMDQTCAPGTCLGRKEKTPPSDVWEDALTHRASPARAAGSVSVPESWEWLSTS